MDAILTGDDYGLQPAIAGWAALTKIIDWVADNWDQPEEGIWETRGGRKDFTCGRLECWVALDRAIRLAERHGRPANVAKWAAERDRIYNQIIERGWNRKVKAFTQHYATEVLDSALLFMPLEGFISPTDPRWLSTLKAMDRELVSDSLVYRYNPGSLAPRAARRGRHGRQLAQRRPPCRSSAGPAGCAPGRTAPAAPPARLSPAPQTRCASSPT